MAVTPTAPHTTAIIMILLLSEREDDVSLLTASLVNPKLKAKAPYPVGEFGTILI